MLFEHAINNINKNPRILFLIDGIGAILSAFLLGVVLVEFSNIFGIPQSTLYLLAGVPCFFAVYDFYCYQKVDKKISVFLKGIAIMNLMYCCLSIGLAFWHYQEITKFGWIYIILEVLIIITLVTLELSIAKGLIRKTV